MDLKQCTFDRVVVLPDSKYQRFLKNMLDDYDFVDQYRDEMYQDGDTVHCILVKGENSTDGILVNSEGGSYARYAAYFPAADLFLKDQQLKQEAQPQHREITQEELAQMYAEHIQWVYGPQGTGTQAGTRFVKDNFHQNHKMQKWIDVQHLLVNPFLVYHREILGYLDRFLP